VLWTRKEIAQVFGAGGRSVDEWVRDPQFPDSVRQGRAHAYPSRDVVFWFINREIQRLVGEARAPQDGDATSVEILNLSQERARNARAQAEQRELDLAERRGSLVDAGAAVTAMAHAIGAARHVLLGVHAAVAQTYPDLPLETIEGIRDLHHEALTALSDAPMPGAVSAPVEEEVA